MQMIPSLNIFSDRSNSTRGQTIQHTHIDLISEQLATSITIIIQPKLPIWREINCLKRNLIIAMEEVSIFIVSILGTQADWIYIEETERVEAHSQPRDSPE